MVDILIDAIANVRRELKFFEDVASRYGLRLDVNGEEEVSEGVRRYRKLFFGAGEEIERHKLEFLDGLVVLWGTEKCYLEAWRYAASQSSSVKTGEEDADGGALRKEFIPNWTSREFEAFVDRLGWFVDEVWKADRTVMGREIGEMEKKAWERKVEGLWGELLEVERVFWPSIE